MSRLWLCVVAILLGVAPAAAADVPPTPAKPAAPATPEIVRIADKLPLVAFAELDFIEQAKISPDGTRIAGIFGFGGQQNIAILSLFNKAEAPFRVAIPDKMEVNWVSWVNEENIIVGVRALAGVEGENWYLDRILAINRVTGKMTKPLWDIAAQNASDVVWKARDGTPEILLAAQTSIYIGHDFWPKVYRVNIETGRFNQVLDGSVDVQDWGADSEGNIRMGVGHDYEHGKLRLMYRRTKNGAFHTVDRADVTKREGLTLPFLFLPESDHALVVSRDKSDHATIDEYDLATMSRVRTVYTSDSHTISPWVDRTETTLLGVSDDSRKGVHWIDPKLAELQTAFDAAVPTARTDILSYNADRTRMLVKIHDADMPGSIYYYDTSEGTLHRIGAINEKVGGKHLAEAKMIKYKARDGLEIEAKITLPTGRAAKNLPLIMMPHGGPWAADTMDYDFLSQFLANRGYVVVQPNFRGSTGYGEDFERKGEGQLGLAMQDDITDGLRWAVAQGIADPKRSCIFGWSYGGYAAMWGIVKDPDQYRCAISMAGLSSLSKDQRSFDNKLDENEAKASWKRMAPDFEAVSPINFINKIKTPLLLLHGKKDVRVDVSQSTKMQAKMNAAGKSVELVVMPLADHNAGRQADRVTLLTAIETFLKKYNPAD